ncbi:hypothetical protein OR263_29190 [Streptomyces sp. NEAU-H22]|uniref:hypothetical protein n=1 Tax=unclassified Streptomyces TaxID=2593676 RepID=UPI00225829C9|nr:MULTISPECIES: hypothetical protein [unclassified Streptomyces]MCX3290734.1 hypothetical protein [Streptomyces sp. NEAU-H22]WMD04641.1 hypothetical protein Q7C01_09670 [Streptomyces sp. FXY-T5]
MRLSWTAFTELLRCTLLGHLRHRLALVLAIAFIPVWIAVARLCTSGQVVRIRLDAISTPVSAPAGQIGQVASALGAITMVAGFIAFTETFQSREMDRRLLLAGYPRLPMLLAKLAAVGLTAVLLALYTTSLLWISLPVRHTAPLALALAGAGLVYGGIGLLLGSLVRGELEGFFLIIMLSLVDTGLQNPVFNSLMDVAGVSALPLYGVNQLALSSALTPHLPWSHGLLSLTWSAATGALALLVLHTQRPSRSPWSRRTRVRTGRSR